MNLAEAANLILTLKLKDEVSRGLKGIQGELDRTSTKSGSLRSGLGKLGTGVGVGIRNAAVIGAGGLALLWRQVDAGIDSLVELEDVQNQTKAAIESTGGAAGLTAEDIRDLAQRMEELSGVDDKVVQSGANVLLTFKNVGKDAFEPATLAALNMSQAMDQDLQTSIVQIGKALNDPVTGLSSLKRIGVTFDEATKDIIEDMVATGDTAGAQQLIIQELNDEFGGSAQASMEGYRGTQLRLKDTWEDLQQTLATALLPALDNLATMLKDKLSDPAVKDGIRKLGEGIAQLFSPENVKGGGEAMKGLFTFLKELPWASIKDGMSFAAENAKKVVDVFRSLPPGVQAGLLTFLAANKLSGGLIASGLGELAKVALSSLKTITAANVTVIGTNVTGGGGVPGAPGGGSDVMKIVGSVTVGAMAAVAFDQFAGATAQGIASKPLTLSAAGALASTGPIAQAISLGNDHNLVALSGILGPGFQNLIRVAGNIADTALNIVPSVNAVGFRVDKLNPYLAGINSGTAAARDLLQTANAKADRDLGISEQIAGYTRRTANNPTTIDISVRTSLNVSAWKIAEAMDHYRRLAGNGPTEF